MQEKRFFSSLFPQPHTARQFLSGAENIKYSSTIGSILAADVAVAEASVTLVLVSLKDVFFGFLFFAVVDRSDTVLR